MSALPEELRRFCEYSETNHNAFSLFHRDSMLQQSLKAFLNATMDDVRLYQASNCGLHILKITDMPEDIHLWQGVLRREISGNIAYPKQRDHFAHTLYNYILGWYIVNYSKPIRKAFGNTLNARGWKNDEFWGQFTSCWPFSSLLHDVGYLFEGSVPLLDSVAQSQQAQVGASVVRDYFQHGFWIACDLDTVHSRQIIREMADTTDPDFDVSSLAEIADALRNLRDLEKLRKPVLNGAKKITRVAVDHPLKRAGFLPQDGFDLWETHYRVFGQESMARRIHKARRIFEYLLSTGLKKPGIRLLDHGICGGLLLLLSHTHFFRIYFGLENKKPTGAEKVNLWNRFRGIISKDAPIDAYWWWSGVAWATAATAIHNIQQMDQDELPDELKDNMDDHLLSLEEDPLAFLGILVDCVQEWDRYTVSRTSAVGGSGLPLQGVDVTLDQKDEVIKIGMEARFAKEAEKLLDRSLRDWKKYLLIEHL